MQLKLTRSQRKSVMGKVIFQLQVRAEISPEEHELIRKYNLGKELVYTSEALNKIVSQAAGAKQMASVMGFAAEGVAAYAKYMGLGLLANFALKITVDELTRVGF